MKRLSTLAVLFLASTIAATGCSADGNDTDAAATSDAAASEGDMLAQSGSSSDTAPEMAATEGDPLLDPDSDAMKEKAPSEFRVLVETTKGEFEIEVNRAWAPRGADRFYNLVRHGFYDGTRFFRVVPNFMVQFGISGKPEYSAVWAQNQMLDDPVQMSNERGYITYAKTARPHSRSTQLFINYKNNSGLDGQGFAPFGKVVGDGMKVVDAITAEYGERPNQGLITSQGNAYLEKDFPNLDYIISATIVEAPAEE